MTVRCDGFLLGGMGWDGTTGWHELGRLKFHNANSIEAHLRATTEHSSEGAYQSTLRSNRCAVLRHLNEDLGGWDQAS
jgi:hypothetical protein